MNETPVSRPSHEHMHQQDEPPSIVWTIVVFISISVLATGLVWFEDNLLPGEDGIESLGDALASSVGIMAYLSCVVVPVTYFAWNFFIAPTLGTRKLTWGEIIRFSGGLVLIIGLV